MRRAALMARLNQRLGFTRYEADEYYQRALDAYKKGDFDNAIDALTDAIDLLPTRAEYLAARGFFFLEDGEPEKAERDFAAAIQHNRYEMLAHYGRGVLAYQAGEYAAALGHFRTASYADAKRGEPLYYMALTALRLNDFASAINFMSMALTAFEKAGDKRRSDASRWLREIQRQAERTGGGLLNAPKDV